jgi:tetratricopeptide (TPR) repeat protein
MIPTRRHLEHASGYIALGLINEAAKEMALIPPEDWARPEVLAVRIELHVAGKEWDMVIGYGEQLARRHPEEEHGWISWGFALRELNRLDDAKAVLLEAEPIHGKECGVLHYNLACYYCLLGNQAEAKKRLRIACKMGKHWKQAALDDEDLKAMWDEIGSKK